MEKFLSIQFFQVKILFEINSLHCPDDGVDFRVPKLQEPIATLISQ